MTLYESENRAHAYKPGPLINNNILLSIGVKNQSMLRLFAQ